MSENLRENKPIEVTDESFAEFVAMNPVAVVDCWAAWCHPCRILSPVIDKLAEEFKGIKFAKLNIDMNPKTPMQYGVMSIPTLLYFKGGKLMDRTVGALPKEAIKNRLNKLVM